MVNKKYSLMILPKKHDLIMLQKLQENENSITFWDGFGSFYTKDESPLEVARTVFINTFGLGLDLKQFEHVATIKFVINKPGEIVELYTNIYEVNMDSKMEDTFVTKTTYQWFKSEDIPYKNMHDATFYWLPLILKGDRIKAIITVNQPEIHFRGKVESFHLID